MKKLKLTKEQYNKLLETFHNDKPIVKGGLNRVSKEFKKYNIKEEYKNLLEYIYGKSKNLSEFWNENNIKYESILESLKDILVKENNSYKLSKSLGSPQDALKVYEQKLNEIVGGLNEGDWFDSHPNNPINQEPQRRPNQSSNGSNVDVKFNNGEIAIIQSENGLSYLDLDNYNSEFVKSANYENSELNNIAYELGYADDSTDGYWTNNEEQINQVLNSYIESNAENLVPINDKIKSDLLDFYSNDRELMGLLNNVNEMDYNDIKQSYTKQVTQPSMSNKSPEEIKQNLANIRATSKKQEDDFFKQRDMQNAGSLTQKTIQKPESIHDKEKQLAFDFPIDEMTSAASSGQYTGKSFFGKLKNESIKRKLQEMTQGSDSIGQYDVNALPIGRNGEFKNVGKTKAQKTPQWAGGEFVEQPNCSKPNNNKEAQNGGCNSGASSLKTRKVKGSVNAPSLGENKIYETIAKQTGKTIDEVKRIIESKK